MNDKKNLKVFTEWVILNQACLDELGNDSGGLRMLMQDRNNPVLKELLHEFKASFISMSDKDEQSLSIHKMSWKEVKKRYAVGTFMLK